MVYCLCKRIDLSEKNKARVQKVKQMIYFNPIIRFLILNTLKLNFNALLVFKSPAEKSEEMT